MPSLPLYSLSEPSAIFQIAYPKNCVIISLQLTTLISQNTLQNKKDQSIPSPLTNIPTTSYISTKTSETLALADPRIFHLVEARTPHPRQLPLSIRARARPAQPSPHNRCTGTKKAARRANNRRRCAHQRALLALFPARSSGESSRRGRPLPELYDPRRARLLPADRRNYPPRCCCRCFFPASSVQRSALGINIAREGRCSRGGCALCRWV